MEQYQSLSPEKKEQNLNVQEQLDAFLIHWKWIVLSIFFALAIAFVYLRYSVPLYSASATVLVRDDRRGGIQSELSAFSDLGLSSVKSNVENEVEILKSRTLVEKVIKKLAFNVTYFTEGRVKSIEHYKDCQIKCVFEATNDSFYNNYDSYYVENILNNNFELLDFSKKLIGKYQFGTIINLTNSKLVVYKKSSKKALTDMTINVRVAKVLDVTLGYKSKINIIGLGKNTSILELNLNDPIKEKAQDFLNEVIAVYNEDAIEDKNYISRKTIDFIENRIKLIATELGNVEEGEEGFKKTNKVTDIKSESNIFLQNSIELEKFIIETDTELKINNTLLEYVKTSNYGDLLPSNVIQSESGAGKLISEYNDLILSRNRVIKEGTKKSSFLENLDQKASDLIIAIKQSLTRIKTNLNIRKVDAQRQLSNIDNKIALIPTHSRELRIIERQQRIKESLYLYLLQKREESAITMAVTSPNAKVIDGALFSSTPVSPNKKIIYLIAFGLGFIIPIGVILLIKLLDTKLKTRQDIESLTSIPFIGDVPKSESSNLIINSTDRSSTAEAIRIVRTNLEFFLSNVSPEKAKTIFLTSTIPKEGKTFMAVNLASTMAISDKKVLLIGLDIRNPQIDKYFDLPPTGIVNYLSKQEQNINDYIIKIKDFENLYVLPAGTIPPNPVEILMNKKVNLLFDELKTKFDYIVVDTAPVSLVTDTLLISKNADAFIYVTRANFLDKRLLETAETFYQEKKLPNMSILLNDSSWKKRYGYGYTYGYTYGYGNQNKKESILKMFWNKIFKS